ncbi:MAG: single-stranded DNA-binding protein [Lachnospiraceae bacterium]|nr:single-stranded DNA-binding protein [Lachnospiraceae bacterium]
MGNQVNLVGNVLSEFVYSHTVYGESFYNATLGVKRDSGSIDLIPLLISERLIGSKEYDCVHITGEFRSYNQHDEDKHKLKLYVFVNSIEAAEDTNNVNDVFLEGYVCKAPTYRHTPKGREISDIMLAVNRQYGKSDYIPCILWGRNAYFAKDLQAGSSIRVAGRIQSREYIKNGESKTAYELSVNLVELC